MSTYEVSAEGRVPATPAQVYALLADYRVGHPSILPPRWFRDLVVEEGGVGEGTVIRFAMTALGATRTARGRVTEPQPGRVLVETYDESGVVTSFRAAPAPDGGTSLTIASTLPAAPGLRGVIERALMRRLLRRIYRDELALIAAHDWRTPAPTVDASG